MGRQRPSPIALVAEHTEDVAVIRRGRPSRYSDEIAEAICERLGAGETLRSICRAPEFPSERTVRGWARDPDHPFSPRYARAREVGYLSMADELIDIADDESIDVNRARLRIDTRKWVLTKALPKIFGSGGDQEGNVAVSEPPKPTMSRLEAARRIAFILNRGGMKIEIPEDASAEEKPGKE